MTKKILYTRVALKMAGIIHIFSKSVFITLKECYHFICFSDLLLVHGNLIWLM